MVGVCDATLRPVGVSIGHFIECATKDDCTRALIFDIGGFFLVRIGFNIGRYDRESCRWRRWCRWRGTGDVWLRKPKCGVLKTEMFHTCYRLQENERLDLYIRRKVKQSILFEEKGESGLFVHALVRCDEFSMG